MRFQAEVTTASFDEARAVWRIELARRRIDRGAVPGDGRGTAAPAVDSRPSRSREFRRRAVPLRPVGPFGGPRRQARGGDRQRRQRRAVRATDRAAGDRAHDLPALGELVAAAQGQALHAAHAAAHDALALARQAAPRLAVVLLRRDAAHAADEAGAHRAVARHALREAAPAPAGARPGAAREAGAGLPDRREARAVQRRLLPDAEPAQRPARDGRRSNRSCRTACARSRASASPPT